MSSEALLGQNVSLIYDFIRQAVAHRNAGEHWASLKMLDTAASLIYLDEDKRKPLDNLVETIEALKEEALKIRTSSEESTEASQRQYLNREAAKAFPTHLKELRNYMQGVGYYTMMNKSWNNRVIEMENTNTIIKPPERKKNPSELSSDVIQRPN